MLGQVISLSILYLYWISYESSFILWDTKHFYELLRRNENKKAKTKKKTTTTGIETRKWFEFSGT